MRQKIVAGNWKSHKTLNEAIQLCSEVVSIAQAEVDSRVQIVLSPPYPYLERLSHLLQGQSVGLAAQNCSAYDQGAYTGEVTASMLQSVGAAYVILGHSERRKIFMESDSDVLAKTERALNSGLQVILCCGEPLDIRENGTHLSYVQHQLEQSLSKLPAEQGINLVVAYEPVWAIGTGKNAIPEQISEMHTHIYQLIKSHWGEVANTLPILYGGSCKPSNAAEIFACDHVDGGLIGGASLVARDFIDISKSFKW